LVLVPNRDEERLFAARLGLGGRTVRLPFGLTDERMEAFWAERRSPAERFANPRLTFVGTWSSRKGSRDLPEIWQRVRAVRPEATLELLGVSTSATSVASDMGDTAGLEVVERFASADLPALLASSTVGVFPSYMEGFPFAVLEKLAAGLPVVAYDAPGARETLGGVSWCGLTAPGDVDAFVAAVVSILDASSERYVEMSTEARDVAERYRWTAIAQQTLDLYDDGLGRLPSWRLT
jgi:glycosyltransferase involved in cell wall biosynthesis